MSWNSRHGTCMDFSYLGAYHIVGKNNVPSLLRKYLKTLPATKSRITSKLTQTRKAEPIYTQPLLVTPKAGAFELNR